MFICDYLLSRFSDQQYSIEKAILIQNFTYWIQFNIVHKKSYYKRGGKYWTKFSVKELHKKYPFIKEQTIRRAICQLLDCGTIQKKYFDGRVSWFTFNDWKLFKKVLTETAGSTKSKKMPGKPKGPLFFLALLLKTSFHIGKWIETAVKSICHTDNSYSIDINQNKINQEIEKEGRAEKPQIEIPDPISDLQKELVKRGVTPNQAVLLYQKCIKDNLKNSEIEIHFQEKIKQFDYLKSSAPEQLRGNPGKFLYNTVKHYISNTLYTAHLLSPPKKKKPVSQEKSLSKQSEQEYEHYLEEQIECYYASLSDRQKQKIQDEVESIIAKKPIRDKEFLKAYTEIELRKAILRKIEAACPEDFMPCR